MSRKAVVDLLAEADTDEKLRQELKAAVEDREHGQQALLAVASAHGHTFTIDEFVGVLFRVDPRPMDGGLSDAELAAVSGGWRQSLTWSLIQRGGW